MVSQKCPEVKTVMLGHYAKWVSAGIQKAWHMLQSYMLYQYFSKAVLKNVHACLP